MITRTLGMGWIPNAPDTRDWGLGKIGLRHTAKDEPSSVSLRRYVRSVFNQGSTNSCVAQALAGAIGIMETQAGLSYSPPSRLFMYFNSRASHGSQNKDAGTFIRTAVKGLVNLGVPHEEFWAFSTNPLRVNRRPGWQPYMMGHPRRDGEYYWIFEKGERRLAAIKAALIQGYPVVFGTLITRRFKETDGKTPISVPVVGEKILGGHAMVITGYVQDREGLRFQILNSWGPQWGDGSFAWLTSQYISWLLAADFCIIRGWNRIAPGKERKNA